MEWKNYLELSKKTLSSEFHVGKTTENLLHAVMGINTEIEELMDNYVAISDTLDVQDWNILEEIGDVFWYTAIIHREYPSFKQSLVENVDNYASINRTEMSNEKLVLGMVKTSLKMLDMLKKKMFYNRDIDLTVFENYLILLESDMQALCIAENIDVQKAFDVNIDKLKARFGDKFSEEKANNRNLDSEKSILENGNI